MNMKQFNNGIRRLLFAVSISLIVLFCNNEPVGVTDIPGSFLLTDTLINVNDTITIDAAYANKLLQGGTLTYSWTVDSQAYLSDTTKSIIRFSASKPGRYKLKLKVFESNRIAAFGTAIIIVQPNEIPVAVIRISDTTAAQLLPDITMRIGDTISLDASKSSSNGNASLTYKWIKPDGGWLSNDTSVNTMFSASVPDTYRIVLIVNDRLGNGRPDTLKIIVYDQLLKKFVKAIATADSIISVGDTAHLDGIKSIRESNRPILFKWQCMTHEPIIDSLLPQAKFTANKAGSYTISLLVCDSTDSINSDRTFITINVIIDKPIADAGHNLSAMTNSTVTLDGRKSTSNPTKPLSYSWSSLFPDGTISNPIDSIPTFSSSKPNTYPISLVVCNGKFYSDTDWIFVTVKDTSIGLKAIVTPECCTIFNGKSIRLNGCESNDSNSVGIQYLWENINGGEIDSPAICSPVFHGNNAATYLVSLRVFNGNDTSARSFTTIIVNDSNLIPTAKINPVDTIQIGQIVQINASESSDPNSDKLTFFWNTPDGGNLSFNSDSSKPDFSAPSTGDYTVFLTVSDGVLESKPVWIVVTITDTQKVPVANAGDNDSVSLGDSLQLNGSKSSDGNNDPLTYKWRAPYGGNLSSDTAEKPWFTFDKAGLYFIGLRVFDGKDSSENIDWIKIKVKDTAFIPEYRPTAIISGKDTSYMIFDIDSIYLDGSQSKYATGTTPVFIWTASGNNPEIVKLDSVSKPVCKISTPGVYTFFLHIFDGYYFSEAAQKTITIFKPKLYVSKTTPWAYQTITAALLKAEAGDTILIGRGKYNENLNVSKSDITFLGMDRINCIVDSLADPVSNSAIFTLNFVNSITIKNLTITHGSPKDSCAGIRLFNCANIIIEENDLVFNNTDGIRMFGSGTVYIRKNKIADNTYNGIRALNSALLIYDNILVDNGLNLGAETADIALEGDNGIRHKIQILNNNITGINSSVYKKDQIKVLSPLDIVVSGNTVKSTDRYGIYCTPASHSWLTVNNNNFISERMTSIFCFETDSLLISNNQFFLENAREPFQKGVDLVNCFKGSIVSNTVKNFWIGIQTDNSPPGGYPDSLVIKLNSFVNDSIGIFAKGAKAPNVHDNIYNDCDTTVIDSTK